MPANTAYDSGSAYFVTNSVIACPMDQLGMVKYATKMNDY
jgi:hypothetical protein